MYFIRIEKLKRQLSTQGLTMREQFQYFMALLLISYLKFVAQGDAGQVWSKISFALISLVAVIVLYFRNGGAAGERFFERYFSLSWVLYVRFVVVLLSVFLSFCIGVYLVGGLQNLNVLVTKMKSRQFWWSDIYIVLFYWRFWVQLGKVRMMRSAAGSLLSE